MAEILVPVSVGELIDKITILRIKQRHIKDAAKLENVGAELRALEGVCAKAKLDTKDALAKELEAINQKLWVIEDDIREKERAKTFDQTFIELARAVYVTNDERFKVKSKINSAAGSLYKEEKSYRDYK